MLILISLCPLLFFLIFFIWKENTEYTTIITKGSDKTEKRKIERRRQRERERERKLLLEPKAPDSHKIQTFIATLKKKLKKPQDQNYKSLVLFEARMLLALSNFLHGQSNKCSYHNSLLREIHRTLIGYVVIPNWKVMREIVTLSKGMILSFGSGQAAFEACLLPFVMRKKKHIICTDNRPDGNPFMSVISMDSLTAVKSFSFTETCLISWPDLDDSHTLKALEARETPFPCIIYVGEPVGGCCGDKGLFNYIETFYKEVKCFEIKGFSNDAVYIYHLK